MKGPFPASLLSSDLLFSILMISVLVVDDSAFMRKAISMMIDRDPEVHVVDTARDGHQAIEKTRELQPDVVTMDIEMPRLDGISALKQIMDEMPRPVLMISSLTKEGADATVKAMEAGAVGFIPKQHSRVSLEIKEIEQELIDKVKSAARSNVGALRRALSSTPSSARQKPPSDFSFRRARLVAIGVSTGGPFALQQMVPALPADLPVPVAIVQHMPPRFTRSLANRLNAMTPLEVVEAEAGMSLTPGRVLIAAGGHHLTFRRGAQGPLAETPDEPEDALHRPSVDVMFNAACRMYQGRVLGVVMTGMGKDGLEGAQQIKSKGGKIIAQDESSSVVYGMPRAVTEANLADLVVPLDEMASTLAQALNPASSNPNAPAPSPDLATSS